jgi:hypothetical protein
MREGGGKTKMRHREVSVGLDGATDDKSLAVPVISNFPKPERQNCASDHIRLAWGKVLSRTN